MLGRLLRHPRKRGGAACARIRNRAQKVCAIVVDQFDSRFQEMNRANDLLSRLKVPVDVLVYTTAEVEEWGDVVNHIVNEALLDGRVVYDAA